MTGSGKQPHSVSADQEKGMASGRAESEGHALQSYYVFLDEGGNLDFSPKGSKYFTMTAVSLTRPFPWGAALSDLRFDLLEANPGLKLEYFHATEDKQRIRDRVFDVIKANLPQLRVDALVVEKSKTVPSLREDTRFYPKMLGYLVRHVYSKKEKWHEPVIIVTDSLPLNRKRQSVEKAIKQTLAGMLVDDATYRVYHHSSMSCPSLQVADYCNWAIFRKWENLDERSYVYISNAIASEFDIFSSGTRHYYQR